MLLTGCLDVVEHGTPVELAINMLDCDRTTVVDGATHLRLTAKVGDEIVLSRTVPIDQAPHTVSIDPNPDVVLQVDASDGTGRLIARGRSIHFASPSEIPVSIDLHRVGQFTRSCKSLVNARAFHSATLLADGRTLVVGGTDSTGTASSSMEVLSSSEIRDVGPLAISAQGNTFRLPRAHHATALLSNGQVLISGGENDQQVLSTVMVVDPSVAFQSGAVGPGPLPRSRHLAIKVNEGVFFVGGSTRSSTEVVANSAVERLDLGTMRMETVSSIPEPRLEAALGRVGPVAIIAGGVEGTTVSGKLELLSIEPSGITRQLALNIPRRGGQLVTHGNRALLVGGFDTNGAPLASTEWINVDPPGASVIAGPTIAARGELCAVALTLGRTLLFGGSRTPEVLNADGSLEPIAFSGSATHGQSCTLVEDGSVLIIGGLDTNDRPVDEVWRFQPSE